MSATLAMQIGFSFDYDAEARAACGLPPRRMQYVGRINGTPLFSDGESDELWSPALEDAAETAWREVAREVTR